MDGTSGFIAAVFQFRHHIQLDIRSDIAPQRSARGADRPFGFGFHLAYHLRLFAGHFDRCCIWNASGLHTGPEKFPRKTNGGEFGRPAHNSPPHRGRDCIVDGLWITRVNRPV